MDDLVGLDVTGEFFGGDVVCGVCHLILLTVYRPRGERDDTELEPSNMRARCANCHKRWTTAEDTPGKCLACGGYLIAMDDA